MSSPAPAFVVKPTSKFVILNYVFTVVLITLAVFIASRYEARREYLYGILVLGALRLLMTAKDHVRLQMTKLTLEDQGLRFHDGFLSKSTRMVNLAKVQDVRVDQCMMDRMLGIGTITLETAGESGRLVMKNIDGPQQIADRILALAQKAGPGAPVPCG